MSEVESHWQRIWAERDPGDVAWFQARPDVSIELIARAGTAPDAAVVDVGGGASRLVDHLLDHGYRDVTVLDISALALERARARLAGRAELVTWVVADITRCQLERPVDLWHDRAVFHFLVDAADRDRYLAVASGAVRPGGHLIVGTFADDGPEQCSGLPVARYSPDALVAAFAGAFEPVELTDDWHRTPIGVLQHFTFGLLRRR